MELLAVAVVPVVVVVPNLIDNLQRRKLSLTRPAGHHGDRIVFGILPIELNIGSQDSICLGIRAHPTLLVEYADILRDNREDRHLKIALNIFKTFHRGI